MANVYARDLQPGMILQVQGTLYFIEDAVKTSENLVRITWHLLGEVKRFHAPVSVMSGNVYALIPSLVIEESPL